MIVSDFVEKGQSKKWFEILQMSNQLFLVVEGKDDCQYYASLLQSYGIPNENFKVKSPSQYFEKLNDGVKGVHQFIDEILTQDFSHKIQNESNNTLLIIADRDGLNTELKEKYDTHGHKEYFHTTKGYAFENDFCLPESLNFIISKLNQRLHSKHQFEINNETIKPSEISILNYEKLMGIIKNVIEELRKSCSISREKNYMIPVINYFTYEEDTPKFNLSDQYITYSDEIDIISLHGKSAVKILFGLIRTLKTFKLEEPKNADTLVNFFEGFIPNYWEEIFDEHNLENYINIRNY